MQFIWKKLKTKLNSLLNSVDIILTSNVKILSIGSSLTTILNENTSEKKIITSKYIDIEKCDWQAFTPNYCLLTIFQAWLPYLIQFNFSSEKEKYFEIKSFTKAFFNSFYVLKYLFCAIFFLVIQCKQCREHHLLNRVTRMHLPMCFCLCLRVSECVYINDCGFCIWFSILCLR